jgi:hypothetical protein
MTAPALRLYEYADALSRIEGLLYEAEGVLTPELEQALNDANFDFDTKAERCALMAGGFLANAAAVRVEEERLGDRRKHYEKAAESLKEYLRLQMQRVGKDKIEGRLASVRVQQSPPKVVCVDASKLPPALLILPPPPAPIVNRARVLELWKSDKPLPEGVSVEVGSHVRIF